MREADKRTEKDKDGDKEGLKASAAEFTKLAEERIELIEKTKKAIDDLIAAGAIKDNFVERFYHYCLRCSQQIRPCFTELLPSIEKCYLIMRI